MKICLLSVQAGHSTWLGPALQEYRLKISPMIPFEVQMLKSKTAARNQAELKKNEESATLLRAIEERDFVIICDERGEQFSSEKFSQKFIKILGSGKSRVVIVVGGAYGISEDLMKRGDLKMSLSTLVFNHWVAQLVVTEQVYRALCIWKGLPYHNA